MYQDCPNSHFSAPRKFVVDTQAKGKSHINHNILMNKVKGDVYAGHQKQI